MTSNGSTGVDPTRLMRCIRDWYLAREEAAWVSAAAHEELMARSDLSRTEAELVAENRVDGLHDAGVAPFTLIQLARVKQFDLRDRWDECTRGDESHDG